jgi:NDP-sugar pyrophosphorylase family protein
MLEAKALFELAEFEHREIFAGTRYAWEALGRLAEYLAARLRPGLRGEVRPGAWIEGEVELGEGSVVEPGALVRGPAIIGPGCEIRQGAYIRGEVILGRGAIVGHCSEIKGSILLNGAAAPHFNYVGDSILGNDVNLGAGTVCSNVKFSGEPVVVRAGESLLPTGRRKLGAIVGDGAQTGCNVVLNPGTVLGRGCRVYPGASVRGCHPANSVIKLGQPLLIEPCRSGEKARGG